VAVTLPAIMPTLLLLTVLASIYSFKQFTVIWLLTGGAALAQPAEPSREDVQALADLLRKPAIQSWLQAQAAAVPVAGEAAPAMAAPYRSWAETPPFRSAATLARAETARVEQERAKVAPGEHPRVIRALAHRAGVRVWTTPDGTGLLVLGRGVCGRWEAALEVAPAARGRGLGTALAAAAPALVPDAALWAQVAPANTASLRAFLAAGWRPVAAEVLFTA